MSRRAFVLVCVALSGCGSPDPVGSYHAPEAYTRRANEFIDRGLVTADCAGDSIRLRVHLEKASVEDVAWFHDSYLSTDVERFNGDPHAYGWLFVLDELCRLRGVNPTTHTIRLPFAVDTRWLGTVYYGGSTVDAVLRSSTREVALLATAAGVPEERLGETYVGALDTVEAEGGVRVNQNPGGLPAADLFPVGQSVVLQSRTGAGVIRVLGNAIPDSRVLRLESGDWVSFRTDAGAEETFQVEVGRTLREASRMRQRNAELTRVTDDPGLGQYAGNLPEEEIPFLALLPRSLDASLQIPRERRAGRGAFDIRLTLDRRIQLRVSRTFERFVREAQQRQPHLAPVTAGLTIMEGRTGDLLALSTFPQEGDLAAVPQEPRVRHRLLLNQNFLPHPIGSAGKPFVFAAILDRHPPLRSMILPPHPDEVTTPRAHVFQCVLPVGYEVHGSATPVDVPTALEISSNRFTVELAVLALAGMRGGTLLPDRSVEWPGVNGASEARLAGAPLAYAPSLERYLVDAAPSLSGGPLSPMRRCMRLNRLEQAPFAARLEDITGASTYQGLRPAGGPAGGEDQTFARYATGRYDLRVWRPLLDQVTSGLTEDELWGVRAAFQGASPERVNLGFNRMRGFREDYVNFLLGGGRSLWTNVQLAEAMSRLVTDRKVEPRMLSAVLPHNFDGAPSAPALELEPLGLAPEARAAVLSGLARVVEGERGTARELAPRLSELRAAFPGDRVLMFAKTGSPRLVRLVPAEVDRPFTNLVARGRLDFRNGTLYVLTGGLQVPHAPVGQPGRSQFEAALHTALREVGAVRSPEIVHPVLLIAFDDFVSQLMEGVPPSETAGPLRVGARGLEFNRSDEFFSRRLMRTPGAVFVFTLVRIPGAGPAIPSPAELQRADARVVTVAIHLAAGPDSRLAVEAAGRVLPQLEPLLRPE